MKVLASFNLSTREGLISSMSFWSFSSLSVTQSKSYGSVIDGSGVGGSLSWKSVRKLTWAAYRTFLSSSSLITASSSFASSISYGNLPTIPL